MQYPIRVFSDLHLAHTACSIKNVQQLRPLLDGVKTAIFNGDTWQELLLDLAEESAVMLAELEKMCVELGVKPVFLPGNHDPSFSDKYWIELQKGAIIILHGDVIFPEVSPWSLYYLKQKTEIDALLRKELRVDSSLYERFRISHKVVDMMKAARPAQKPRQKNSLFHYYVNTLWPPQRLWILINLKRLVKKEMARFAEHYFPDAELVILGHFHAVLNEHIRSKHYLNTGAFMAGCKAQAVDITENSYTLRPVILESNESFVLSDGEKFQLKKDK